MAGIYIHIPFCRKACHYCNFHFSTVLHQKNELVHALVREIEHRATYLPKKEIQSIYFGGGTPSVLEPAQINLITDRIFSLFSVNESPEITLEANPDDLSVDYLTQLKGTAINRLSIGLQAFDESILTDMNRSHNLAQALRVIPEAQDLGWTNLTVDLIYGIPALSSLAWEKSLAKIDAWNIPHLSSYCLTVEPNTALHKHIEKGITVAPEDKQASEQFQLLMDWAERENWKHYEISNLCKKGFHAIHNSSYWAGDPYLGIGPGAHSFNGNERQWNRSNNAAYIRTVKETGLPENEKEMLTKGQHFNEFIMTRLRLINGLSLVELVNVFGDNYLRSCVQEAAPYLESGLLVRNDDRLFLSSAGRHFADRISSDLFIVE